MEKWLAFVWYSLNFIINLRTHISIYFKVLCWNRSFNAFITKSLVYKNGQFLINEESCRSLPSIVINFEKSMSRQNAHLYIFEDFEMKLILFHDTVLEVHYQNNTENCGKIKFCSLYTRQYSGTLKKVKIICIINYSISTPI